METEESKERNKIDLLERQIKTCEEGIAKAEKYERLKDNQDWKDFILDLKILAEKHDQEIKNAEVYLLDAPNTGYLKLDATGRQAYVSSREDWIDFIVRHQIQKEENLKWLKEPDYVLRFAALSREKLPEFQKHLRELTHVDSSVGNGSV